MLSSIGDLGARIMFYDVSLENNGYEGINLQSFSLTRKNLSKSLDSSESLRY